ncbi:unnamed protein product [Spodoptera littoralis]|uniref:Sperm microtubule inner protein 1 C-terminal domain-containing protein n=1 Tax=Spodoptera littoralis TaxID=7109 RepID=A0A9P0MXT1_SPOLI|nr:unnamed protein product [Spodoptera littoralis]CAH1637337.1 unnamed protein product [Spodoptera littoralis]
MPLIDINKPEMIKFLVETYEKTARLRMRWNTHNADKLRFAATLNREEKGYEDIDVTKATMELGLPGLKRDSITDARNRRLKHVMDGNIPGIESLQKGHSIVEVDLGNPKDDPKLARPDTDLSIDPIMRPVNPKQKKIIYKGRPYFGREVYLTNRCKAQLPEDRYYFAETSSWAYGWRLKDSSLKSRGPQHGRVWRLSREISRTGPAPDPAHYQKPRKDPGVC